MKLSQQGIDLLIEREGKRNTVYLDTEGYPTVGVGHMDQSLTVGDVWTDEQVEEAFRQDVSRFEDAINDALTVCIKQNQFDALVSWLFNVGTGWASKSMLMKLVNAQEFEKAVTEFDKWHIPASIITRRNGEREQFAGRHFVARYSENA
jgi:lysozyme